MKLVMTGQEIVEESIRQQFTDEQWSTRRRHIQTLRNFAGASVAAANALAVIRDKKLYRPHSTLKEFCQRECGWSEQRLFQVLKFAQVRASLPEKTQPLVESERVARELARVPEDKREEILNEAKQDTNGTEKVTAASVRKAIKRVGITPSTAGKESSNGEQDVDELGFPIPKPAQEYWNRRKEAAEVLAQLRYAKTKVRALKPEDPMWAEVNLNGVLSDLGNAINRFAAAVPAYVCTHCQGQHPKGCTVCKGRGLVSSFMWKTCIPEELRKMRKAQIK